MKLLAQLWSISGHRKVPQKLIAGLSDHTFAGHETAVSNGLPHIESMFIQTSSQNNNNSPYAGNHALYGQFGINVQVQV